MLCTRIAAAVSYFAEMSVCIQYDNSVYLFFSHLQLVYCRPPYIIIFNTTVLNLSLNGFNLQNTVSAVG